MKTLAVAQPARTIIPGTQHEALPDTAPAPVQAPPARPETESPHHHRSANVESSRMRFLGRILNGVKRTSGAVVSRLETSAQERMSIARQNVQSMKKKYSPEKRVVKFNNIQSELNATAPSSNPKHYSFNAGRGIVSRKPKLSVETADQSEHANRRENRILNFFSPVSFSTVKRSQPTISVAIGSTSHVVVSTSVKRPGPETLVALLEGNRDGIRAGLETLSTIPYVMDDFQRKKDLLSEKVAQLRRLTTGLSGMAGLDQQIRRLNIDTAALSIENLNRIAARAVEIYHTPIQANHRTHFRTILFRDLGEPAIYGDSGQAQGSTLTRPNLSLSREVWLNILRAKSQTNSLLRELDVEIAALKRNLQASVTSGPENTAEASIAPHVGSDKGKGRAKAPVPTVSKPKNELSMTESVLAAGSKAKQEFAVLHPEVTDGLFQYK